MTGRSEVQTENVCVCSALASGHGGPGLLDGLNPAMAPVGGMVTAAPVVNSTVHATNNISGKQMSSL